MIQSKTVDDTIKAQIQRLIERTNLEIQNLESQLHDAHDIDYVEFTQTQARVPRTKAIWTGPNGLVFVRSQQNWRFVDPWLKRYLHLKKLQQYFI